MAEKMPIVGKNIEQRIYLIRGLRVMIDSDLAELYGVSTGRLNEAVRRNLDRFPSDFMFQLSLTEFRGLISQIAISKYGRGGRRKFPLVFTQEGVAMLSGILRSSRAVKVNIAVMRSFVRLREALSATAELASKLKHLESRITTHDEQIKSVFEAVRELLRIPEESKKRIGFTAKEKRAKYVGPSDSHRPRYGTGIALRATR